MTPSRVKPRSIASALEGVSKGGWVGVAERASGREMMGCGMVGGAKDLGSGGVVARVG